jgi:hypothetical protein
MLSEDEMYLYAVSCGWMLTVELLHAREYIRGVFLTRASLKHFWGPIGAVQRLPAEEFFAYLEDLECSAVGPN